MEEKRGQSTIERVFLHVIQAVTVTGILGGYVALTQLKTSNAVLQTQMENLTTRIDDFKTLSADRYTASQAIKDLAPLIETNRDHESRIRHLERQIISGEKQ